MLQPGRLEDLGEPVHGAEDDPDAHIAPRQGQGLAPEGDSHDGRGDGEPHGEEVGRWDVGDEVADEEERRPPHGGDDEQEEGGEPALREAAGGSRRHR